MTAVTDIHGNILTGASAAGAEAFSGAVRQLSIYAGDPLATVESLIESEPRFTMAYVLKAWLFSLGTDATAVPTAKEAIEQGMRLAGTDRERGHLAALAHLAEGRFHDASRAIEDVTVNHPRDLLGLIGGHQMDFFTGNSRMLRDRISRALPQWSRETPGYHALLGMSAFGQEEMGNYALAEERGREALALEPHDGWAKHAVAHVLEMQGRHDEGIAFMREDVPNWTDGSFFAVHNWWHLALYHLELGQIDEVLALFDGPITSAAQPTLIDLVDASAMLWRLHLRGIELGSRWQKLAERWEAQWKPGFYAFNDLHALMAFAGAGRRDLVQWVIRSQKGLAADNVMFSRDAGLPLMQGFAAFADRNYREAVAHMRPVRGIAARFGGSHAQRDVIDLTLIEAALRDGELALARAFAAERAAAKHESPLVHLFAQRSGLKAAA
jgi:tetratricopeptide (TPR) repeat protein